MPRIKLGVLVPSGDQWYADFGNCLVFMVAKLARLGIEVKFYNARFTLLAISRQLLVQCAEKDGCTHVLFIDSDMTFPPDTATRLLSHNKMIIACNIPCRRFPYEPVARKIDGKPIWTKIDSSGLEEVGCVGLGIILINIDVFCTIKIPYFGLSCKNCGKGIVNVCNQSFVEDYSFCYKVKVAGFSVYIDHDLSKDVGHIQCLPITNEYVEFYDKSVELTRFRPKIKQYVCISNCPSPSSYRSGNLTDIECKNFDFY